MRHAARAAAAAGRAAAPARRAGGALGGEASASAAFATHAPAVVHPPKQSVRPGFTKDDPSHTSKWQQAPVRSPQDWIATAPPVEVKSGNVARCYGVGDPALGHPVEFIVLNDTSAEFPAVCKYCGSRFFQGGHHGH